MSTPLFKPSDLPAVVSLCDRSGVMVRPWAEAGFECWCVDLKHSIRRDRREGNVNFVWGDVRSWVPPREVRGRVGILFSFFPCTSDAVSGARDFLKKGPMMLADSLELFNASRMAGAWSGAPYAIEHPVTSLSSYVGKPDHTFQPWQYGDGWAKQTCLWTGNGFVMPEPTVKTKPEGVTQKIWLMPPGEERQDRRAETPPGFARAVFEANAPKILRKAA